MRRIAWTLGLLSVSVITFAQNVPPIDPTTPLALPVPKGEGADNLPPINWLAGKEAHLNPLEQQSVKISKDWINASAIPAAGENGALVYTYGTQLPTVVCSPLHICDVALEPGEVINDLHNGDRVRWKVYPSVSGSGTLKTTHLIIKATDTNLTTNLNVSTDRRTYIIKLVSRKEDWMPLVSFAYPEETEARWQAYQEAQAKHEEATTLTTGENVATLDFNYRLQGSKVDWRPLRVYNNGAKTYVQFSAAVAHGDLPALVALGAKDAETLVNYRLIGDRFEVDKLLTHAALIRGAGRHQERVEITYDGKP
jgi:type IV secretion system protein VirB9